jgi:hypothetical protein
VRANDRLSINEDRQRRFGKGEPARLLALICECGDDECHRTVVLTLEEYRARRPGLILHHAHDADRSD